MTIGFVDSCFYEGRFYWYDRTKRLGAPGMEPTRLQLWVVCGTVLYCVWVVWPFGGLRWRPHDVVEDGHVAVPLESSRGQDEGLQRSMGKSRRAGRVKPIETYRQELGGDALRPKRKNGERYT